MHQAYDTAEKSTSVGGGSLDNVKIEPHANTTFQFPFQIKYDASKDPNSTILKDIASKCGISLQGVTSGSVGSGDLDVS